MRFRWITLAGLINSTRLTVACAQTVSHCSESGLWTDPNPVPPWEWRKHREKLTDHPVVCPRFPP